MQKIKLSIINNLIECGATAKEIDFLIYISRFQDETGEVRGVYYKDVCSVVEMSYQSFYDVKESLTRKGLILVKRESDIDYDITILNNDFTDGNYKDGYISTKNKIFQSKDFYKMKANEKLMAIDLMKITYANKSHWKIGLENFYEKYSSLFRVTYRVIRGYIKTIKKFFYINLENFNYIIIPKRSIGKPATSEKTKSDELQCYEHIIKAICRRTKIKEVTADEISDTAKLIHQYKEISSWVGKNIIETVIHGIYESLEQINQYKSKGEKKLFLLRPKLIHIMIKKELKMS